jgi:hypothetical protein
MAAFAHAKANIGVEREAPPLWDGSAAVRIADIFVEMDRS